MRTSHVTIRVRRGTAAEWASKNPILALGELGLETDTGKLKGGDDVRAWNDLPYADSGVGVHAATHQPAGSDPIPVFTAGAAGQVPASGGGTTNFLRADGAFAAPPAGGTPPTGTGFRHVTDDVEDAASKRVDTADINDAQVTYAKMQDVSAASKLLGRGAAAGSGDAEEITLGTGLSMSGTTLNAEGGSPITRINGASGAAGADLTFQKLSSNAAENETTTLATVMTTTGVGAGTWRFRYSIIYQSASTGNGVDFAIGHSGTVTQFVASSWFITSGGSAATALADQVSSNTANLAEGKSQRTLGAKMGSSLGVDTINANMLTIIEGIIVVSASGSLTLQHASETVTASGTTVMAESCLELTKIG